MNYNTDSITKRKLFHCNSCILTNDKKRSPFKPGFNVVASEYCLSRLLSVVLYQFIHDLLEPLLGHLNCTVDPFNANISWATEEPEN